MKSISWVTLRFGARTPRPKSTPGQGARCPSEWGPSTGRRLATSQQAGERIGAGEWCRRTPISPACGRPRPRSRPPAARPSAGGGGAPRGGALASMEELNAALTKQAASLPGRAVLRDGTAGLHHGHGGGALAVLRVPHDPLDSGDEPGEEVRAGTSSAPNATRSAAPQRRSACRLWFLLPRESSLP